MKHSLSRAHRGFHRNNSKIMSSFGRMWVALFKKGVVADQFISVAIFLFFFVSFEVIDVYDDFHSIIFCLDVF